MEITKFYCHPYSLKLKTEWAAISKFFMILQVKSRTFKTWKIKFCEAINHNLLKYKLRTHRLLSTKFNICLVTIACLEKSVQLKLNDSQSIMYSWLVFKKVMQQSKTKFFNWSSKMFEIFQAWFKGTNNQKQLIICGTRFINDIMSRIDSTRMTSCKNSTMIHRKAKTSKQSSPIPQI